MFTYFQSKKQNLRSVWDNEKSLLGSGHFFFLVNPAEGNAVLGSIKLSQKVTQVWSCAPKTLTTGVTELPVNRPESILGKPRQGFVIQHKAVTSSSMLSLPVSNYSVGKQQNISSKRPIQNWLTSK